MGLTAGLGAELTMGEHWRVVVLLGLGGLCGAIGACLYYPYTMCRYCENGKNWDQDSPKHFWKGCSGRWWLFGTGSCNGVGHKLRWEVKVLQRIGLGRSYPDPLAPK